MKTPKKTATATTKQASNPEELQALLVDVRKFFYDVEELDERDERKMDRLAKRIEKAVPAAREWRATKK